MKTIIAEIQSRLVGNSNIKYVDENWGQLDYYSPNFPVKWPCVLIDIADARFSDIGRDNSKVPAARQIGSLVIELRIANLRLTNTSGQAPRLQQLQARSIHDLIEEVHATLHDWSPVDHCTKLVRQSQTRVKRDDGVQEYAVRYSLENHNC